MIFPFLVNLNFLFDPCCAFINGLDITLLSVLFLKFIFFLLKIVCCSEHSCTLLTLN